MVQFQKEKNCVPLFSTELQSFICRVAILAHKIDKIAMVHSLSLPYVNAFLTRETTQKEETLVYSSYNIVDSYSPFVPWILSWSTHKMSILIGGK